MARTVTLRDAHGEYTVTVDGEGRVELEGAEPLMARPGPGGTVRVGHGSPRQAWTVATNDARWVFLDGGVYRFDVVVRGSRRKGRGHHGSLAAPMPATVRKIQVEAGDAVKRGDVLIVLEAMKMELPIRATADGVVAAINCREGELVSPGVGLIEIDDNGD
jgi:3-methylcrotonyl-CoA carboxylase alpha subunit